MSNPSKATRDELVVIVRRLLNGDVSSDEEVAALVSRLKDSVSYPGVSDLIFWSDEPGTPEEIVDRALAYEPAVLTPPASDNVGGLQSDAA